MVERNAVMMTDFRTWKWMVPGLAASILLALQLWISDLAAQDAGSPLSYCGYATVPMMLILCLQAWAGFRAYYRQIDVDQLTSKRNALATTAEIRLFEATKNMHPDAVRLLLKHRMAVWRIRETPINELADWVLDADPRVHYRFVEFVLLNSNFYNIYPKNRLNDKARSFDPTGVVTDYEQYDAFVALLQNRLMLTEAYGNQPGLWIEPWKPELVARHFGVVFEADEKEEELIAVKEATVEIKS